MTEKTRRHLIGLWRIWDILPDHPDARGRPPEAILERRAAIFPHEPDAREIRGAFTRERDALDPEVETSELAGHLVLDDASWDVLRNQSGWDRANERRHDSTSRRLPELTAYGILPERLIPQTGTIWSFAKDFGPSIVGVSRNLEKLGDDMGLPPVEFGPEVPFFEGRSTTRRQRGGRTRDRGAAGD